MSAPPSPGCKQVFHPLVSQTCVSMALLSFHSQFRKWWTLRRLRRRLSSLTTAWQVLMWHSKINPEGAITTKVRLCPQASSSLADVVSQLRRRSSHDKSDFHPTFIVLFQLSSDMFFWSEWAQRLENSCSGRFAQLRKLFHKKMAWIVVFYSVLTTATTTPTLV